MLLHLLRGKRQEAQGEGEQGDGRKDHGQDLVGTGAPCPSLGSRVPSPAPPAGAGHVLLPGRRTPGSRGSLGVGGLPPDYIGNAFVLTKAESTAGEMEKNGIRWAAWLLNRALFDEGRIMRSLSSARAALLSGSSPWFDMFGNDFGLGKPLTVRGGAGNKMDGKATVFEGHEMGGSMSLEVCLTPDVLARIATDEEFMDAISLPAAVK
ncbi:unnamed protein product [Urochloa humidicola]